MTYLGVKIHICILKIYLKISHYLCIILHGVWLHLQDIYGDKDFPTTNKELDILKYKPDALFNNYMLTNID